MAVKSFPILAGLNCVCDRPLYSVVRPIHLAEPPQSSSLVMVSVDTASSFRSLRWAMANQLIPCPKSNPQTITVTAPPAYLPIDRRHTTDCENTDRTNTHTHTHTTDRGLAALQDLGRGRRNLVFVQFVKDMELGNDLVYGYVHGLENVCLGF